MRKKNYKGRCEKKSVPKCNEIFKAYDAIQNAYVDVLSSRNDIVCIFRKNCASVPEERSAIPLQTEQSSAG